MNYKFNPSVAGQLLKQVRRSNVASTVAAQYLTLPKERLDQEWLFPVLSRWRHSQFLNKSCYCVTSLCPWLQIKEMNIYSNNEMAEMLAQSLGSAVRYNSKRQLPLGVPQSEIQLVNGSGLGAESHFPRAVCAMFMAIQRELLPHHLRCG